MAPGGHSSGYDEYSPPTVGNEYDEESWLWCRRCERFFQVKDLGRDSVGGRQGCPFENCPGEGLGYDLLPWESVPLRNPGVRDRWPKSVVELKSGMRVSA